MMTQKTGALIFDETADRYDIRFDVNDYYGGLHCGDCMEVFVRGKWKPTRTDKYFQAETAEPTYQMAGKEITPKLLLEAIRTLPEEKRTAILLYYFEGMTDVEIGKMFNTSRSTIQYRRTSSFELLKKYLEEHADEWNEW